MTDSESMTLEMLKRIDQKLDALLQKMSRENRSEGPAGSTADFSRLACARQIAALTPRAARQTDAVKLLREDRAR